LLIQSTKSLKLSSSGSKSRVINVKSSVSVASSLQVMTTVPCFCSDVTGDIGLITAVVGLGETGNIFSPNKALEKEDFPALNAPNNAIVNSRLSNRVLFVCNS